MKKSTAPISLAGCSSARRVMCARFSTVTAMKNIACCFRSLKTASSVATRRFTSSIQINITTICNGWRRLGIDAAAAQQSGQFELRTNTETYLRDGRFDQDRMLEVFEQLASGNAKGGFPLSRIVCRMDWAVEDQSHVDDLIEFESRVNDVWRRHDDAVICTYHLGKFGGDTVIDIMRTHPMVIIGGILQQNPFFVPPEEFLREIRDAASRAEYVTLDRGLKWKCNPRNPPRKSSTSSAASTIWSVSSLFRPSGAAASRSQIAQTLLDTLLGMLSLDLVLCAAERPGRRGAHRDGPRRSMREAHAAAAGDRRVAQRRWLGDDPQHWPSRSARTRSETETFRFVPLRLGLHGEIGVMVAGSQRADFPEQTERLLLSVAANQAAIGLQEARLRSEQKRVASELDQRVAQRTRELAQANEELQLQVGLLQHFPVAAWTLDPDGTPDFVNQTGWNIRVRRSITCGRSRGLDGGDSPRGSGMYFPKLLGWRAFRAGLSRWKPAFAG